MPKIVSVFVAAVLLLAACAPKQKESAAGFKPAISQPMVNQVIDSLVNRYGNDQKDRIERGVSLASSFWRESDGTADEFAAFCKKYYVADPAARDKLFDRISTNLEVIFGYFNKISVDLQRPLQLDMGDMLPVDELFGAYSPSTHFTDDFFANRLAFVICLNFPYYSLEDKNMLAPEWNRKQWAWARLGDVFDSRVPADVNQQVVNALTRSDMYIADYNIFAGMLADSAGARLFPDGMKLLSHWNIRDEIKSNYGKPGGLAKQQLLYAVMKRIITQEIPQEVINSDAYTWNPYTNKVLKGTAAVEPHPEAEKRYAVLLDFFHAQQQLDPYYPQLDSYIKRTFDSDMEIPLGEVEVLFTEYLRAPQLKQVAEVIRKRLGRDLQPFDIWYDGFKTRTTIPSETLDKATQTKYPNREAVQADLPGILMRLGFEKNRALEIASHIQVDPARGSGHASGSETREQKSLLRTRIFSNGMDYKGYNIAVHEFGHNVEQTISLHNVDYYMMRGVPNTAFTEALAFIFQSRDLKLLGMKEQDPQQVYLNNLDSFWSLYEIMGVSLVDIGTWKWLYAHPDATAAQLRDAVNALAIETWNTYFAPVFGIKDQPVLAIYSHMINAPLYLPNYAYGQIIEFQIEDYIKDKNFAAEIERIFSLGRLTPKKWMKEAVGGDLSVQPIMHAADEALQHLK